MKLSVLYHSKSGNTQRMGEVIVEGMTRVAGVEARAYAIDAIDEAWLQESRAVVIGTPIYLATMSGALKNWFDGPSMKLGLAGKIGGAFATANYLHGGGEIGIQSILSHMMVKGMLTYSGGGACGQPVIHLGPVALGAHLDDARETFLIYGERMATKAVEIFGK